MTSKCALDQLVEQCQAIRAMQGRIVPGIPPHEQDDDLVRALATATHVLLDTIGHMTDNDWSGRLPDRLFATMLAEGALDTIHDAGYLHDLPPGK